MSSLCSNPPLHGAQGQLSPQCPPVLRAQGPLPPQHLSAPWGTGSPPSLACPSSGHMVRSFPSTPPLLKAQDQLSKALPLVKAQGPFSPQHSPSSGHRVSSLPSAPPLLGPRVCSLPSTHPGPVEVGSCSGCHEGEEMAPRHIVPPSLTVGPQPLPQVGQGS